MQYHTMQYYILKNSRQPITNCADQTGRFRWNNALSIRIGDDYIDGISHA
jgi:hypothetical protein